MTSVWDSVSLLRAILAGGVLLILPGLLLVALLRIEKLARWELVAPVVGLSLIFLIVTSLAANELLPIFNPAIRPLATLPLLCIWAASALTIAPGLPWTRLPSLRSVIWHIHPAALLYVVPAALPVLGCAGAIALNYGFGNALAIANLLLVAGWSAFLLNGGGRLPPGLRPWTLFTAGISLALAYSLRGPHIDGWDINQELFVYQLTATAGRWDINTFIDPYNASLSINLLPTAINAAMNIPREYVFKGVYPILFSLVPVVMYSTAVRHFSQSASFAAGLFFIFQPWFMQPMPALARQEIALLLFALYVWACFTPALRGWQRSVLQILFGTAVVFSHYSTAYVGFAIVTVAYVGARVIGLARGRAVRARPAIRPAGFVIFWLWSFSFLWGGVFTGTSSGVPYVLGVMLENLSKITSPDLRSQDARLALALTESIPTPEDLAAYVESETSTRGAQPDRYPPSAYADHLPRLVAYPKLAGVLGHSLTGSVIDVGAAIVRLTTKAALVLGVAALLVRAVRIGTPPIDFTLLAAGGVLILAAFSALPALSLYYNVFRVYMQLLVVGAVALPFGILALACRVAGPRTATSVLSGLLIVFFLSSYGVIALLAGGSATMNLNNLGEDYDKFYTHDTEVLGAVWLSEHRVAERPIYADAIASLRLIGFGGILDTEKTLLPGALTRDGYVYLRWTNVHEGITESVYNGLQLSYNAPLDFLAQQKNLIYDNGDTRIFE